MARPYDLEFRLERAKEIERALYKKGWTRSFLATKTGYDEKTIRNLLSGEAVKLRTLHDVCEALEIEPRIENDIENIDCADDVFGGYLRKTHSMYEGIYCLYRRSFTTTGKIFKSIVKINWDVAEERFGFIEYFIQEQDDGRQLGEHTGAVYVSSYTNLVHMLTIFQGSIRLITLTKMRQADGIMRGAISSQSEDINYFQPTISAVVLRKIRSPDTNREIISDVKILSEEDGDFSFATEQLKIAEQKVIKICVP